MTHRTWTVAQAKEGLAVIIDSARLHGPQTITRRGQRSYTACVANSWIIASPTALRGSAVSNSNELTRQCGFAASHHGAARQVR